MTERIKLSASGQRAGWELPILYEDAHLLAVDKPAGLRISPDRLDASVPSLLGLMRTAIGRGAPWARVRGVTYLQPAHRLDPETSGVLLLALTRQAFLHVADQFGSEAAEVWCLGVVAGTPARHEFEVKAPLGPDPTRPGRMRADPLGGKKARTRFQVRERFRDWTLLACRPFTYRPHQVRAHLRCVRMALAGDSWYEGRPLLLSRLKPDYRLKPGALERPLLGRPLLHVESVTISHPAHGQALTVRAPEPKDLAVALKYLHRYGGA